MIHALDSNRGRYNMRRCWTLCGEARATYKVSRHDERVTCPKCLKVLTEKCQRSGMPEVQRG